jgi:hypothetical protein
MTTRGMTRNGATAILASTLLYGAGIGALIKRDRWREVPLERVRVSLAKTRGRGVALSLSVPF